MSEDQAMIVIPGTAGEVSDGYHTFNELYEHRHALFIALVNRSPELDPYVWKSWQQSDGKQMEGWFIAGITLPNIGQISYHMPKKYWGVINANILHMAPPWDGHRSKDVVERLILWANSRRKDI